MLGALILAGGLLAMRVVFNTGVNHQDSPLTEPADSIQASDSALEQPSDKARNATLISSDADDEPGIAAAQPEDSERQARRSNALASSELRRSEPVSSSGDPIAIDQSLSSANTKTLPEAQSVHNGADDLLSASNRQQTTQHNAPDLSVLEQERGRGYSEYGSSPPDRAKLKIAKDAPDAVFSVNVARAQFSTEIVEREPVDRIGALVSMNGEPFRTVYYFTEIANMSGQTVIHRWEHNGSVVAEVLLDIGSDRWRTWSSKELTPALTGQWRVSVVSADGTMLRTDSFVYADSRR